MTTATVPTTARRFATEPDGRPHRATFVDTVRSEWLKLVTVRSTWVTLVVAVVLADGIGTLVSYLAGSHYGSSSLGDRLTWDPTQVSFFALNIAQLAVAVLGVMIVTSEYGTGMIRTSLAATPQRTKFLAAKSLVVTAVLVVVGEITAFVAFLLGQAVISGNAPTASLGDRDVLRAVIGAGLYLALIGLLGAAIGAIVRSTAAGISTIVALLFVLPGVVQALPSSWAQPITEYWPTQAGRQILVLHRDAHTLAAWSGFGVMVLFTVIVLIVASQVIERRDA